jgi:hypothetical protein
MAVLDDLEIGRNAQHEPLGPLPGYDCRYTEIIGVHFEARRMFHARQGKVRADLERVLSAITMHRKVGKYPMNVAFLASNKSDFPAELLCAQTAPAVVHGIKPPLDVVHPEIRNTFVVAEHSVRNRKAAAVTRTCGEAGRNRYSEKVLKVHD